MPTTKLVALLMLTSLCSAAVAASAQEVPKSEPREAVAEFPVNRLPQAVVPELAKLNPSAAFVLPAFALPDAPVAAMKPLAFDPISFAVPQQPGNPNPRASYTNPNRRKYIVLGVICAAAIVGAIVIATQHD